MRNSLFTKYFATCAIVVIALLTLLGAIIMIVAAQYFRSEKYDLLKSNTMSAVELTADNCSYDADSKVVEVNAQTVRQIYLILANAVDAQFVFVDNTGKASIAVSGIGSQKSEAEADVISSFSSYRISEGILKKMDAGEYYEVGRLGGIYSSQHYTYGAPVTLKDGTTVGYLLASTPATAMTDFLLRVLQMFTISAAIVIILSFIIFYFITLQMVKPLRKMAGVAKKFGSGDFSERIEVRGTDEVAELARSLNNMAQSLSVTETARRSFVANVSHELRTPMTTIAGFVDGILDGTIPKEKEGEYLAIVSDEVKRLSRLVRAMLNMSRLETGEIQLSKTDFDVRDVVLQTLFSFEHAIEEKRVEITGLDHDKVIVEADQDLIHQVVYNLIENAVKFVDEGGRISFDFRTERDRTYIIIRNTGAGLSRDEARRVFERFYKSDKSRSLDKNGVGLGLYIVRSIIELHGGEITVRSEENEYCEFEFYLPSGKLSKTHKKTAGEARGQTFPGRE